jgi:hypothetical protein
MCSGGGFRILQPQPLQRDISLGLRPLTNRFQAIRAGLIEVTTVTAVIAHGLSGVGRRQSGSSYAAPETQYVVDNLWTERHSNEDCWRSEFAD